MSLDRMKHVFPYIGRSNIRSVLKFFIIIVTLVHINIVLNNFYNLFLED